ncbi:TPA: hypothetical protein MHZ99_21255 [Klebsiella pneumoniae subsp. pneumoniae]|nr:hypothetical protein [Klebsiella pneumoniae subsp. pneumoniae]
MSNFNGFTGNNDPVYYSRKTEKADGALTGEDTKQAGNSPVIPEGYVLVPKEPTAQMYDAGDRQMTTKQVWDAMLAAAPQEVNHG